MLTDLELKSIDAEFDEIVAELKRVGVYDTSPTGTPGGRQNWVDKTGGLPPFIRAIVHALKRGARKLDESSAVRIAIGTCQRWARGGGNVTAKTRAKATAALAALKAKGAASRTATAVRRTASAAKSWQDDLQLDTKESPMGANQDIPNRDFKVAITGEPTIVDDEKGIVEAIVSVTGIVDNVNDNILPGAFIKTLSERSPKMVWSHDWNRPVGKTLSITELMPGDPNLPKTLRNGDPWPATAGALVARAQFNLGTDEGKNAYSNVKFYDDQCEWSIGYQVPVGGAKMDSKTGVRMIDYMNLYEYSPVLFGAMSQAVTQSVKDAHDGVNTIDGHDDDGEYWSGETKKAFTQEQREEMAKDGRALPDGSFPIDTGEDLDNAIVAAPRAKNEDLVKRHIVKRAKALNLMGKLPESMVPEGKAAGVDTDPAFMDGIENDATVPQTIQVDASDLNMLFIALSQAQEVLAAVSDGSGFEWGKDTLDPSPTQLVKAAAGFTSKDHDALAVCPMCDAAVGKPCVTKKGKATSMVHINRPKTPAVLHKSDDEAMTATKLVGFLAEYKDALSNFETLEETATTFDEAVAAEDFPVAQEASDQFTAELMEAIESLDDEDEAQAMLTDVAADFGDILDQFEDIDVTVAPNHPAEFSTSGAKADTVVIDTKAFIL